MSQPTEVDTTAPPADDTLVDAFNAASDKPAKAKPVAPAKVKRVKIILDENDAIPPGGQFFGVNGTGYQIQPGKEVDVPEFLLDVLDNAVTTKPVMNDDGQVIGYRDVPRFSYRIVR